MTAVSFGVQSRPVKFKLKSQVAPLLNLVVDMKQGAVTNLTWINNCNDLQGCSIDECKSTSLSYNGTPVVENNCFKQAKDCTANAGAECDTQVFVTWTGTDKHNWDMTSDNFRLSGFSDYGVRSYLDAARNLW